MKLASGVALALGTVLLAGCSALSSDRTPNYITGATQSRPLEVPPDLTQLARDNRALAPGGVVTASQAQRAPGVVGTAGANTPGAIAPVVSGPPVAVQSQGQVRVERSGQQRWLVVAQPPEQLWQQVKSFWEENGFTLKTADATAGVMETEWSENRAKISGEVARNALARALGRVFDSGERDQYRTRLEAVDGGTEIFIIHRGVEETFNSNERVSTDWRVRPNDPSLEAEFMARLMVKLGGPVTVPATTAVAEGGAVAGAREAVAQARERPVQARALAAQPAPTLELDESFDRAWRRVGLALDRGGFSVEDRDRAGGIYYVRYIDPKLAGKEEPGFWSRLFSGGSAASAGPVRYRITLVAGTGAAAQKTVISVLTSAGGNDSGEDGQRIVERLVEELR